MKTSDLVGSHPGEFNYENVAVTQIDSWNIF